MQNGELIMGIDLVHLGQVVTIAGLAGLTLDVLPRNRIGRRHHVITLGGRRNQTPHPIVIGPVRRQALFQRVVKELIAAAHLAVRPQHIHEEVGPLIDKFRAAHQSLNQLLALVRGRVRRKVTHLRRSRNAPRQVELYATQELQVCRQRRMRNTISPHLAKDLVVNKVAMGNLRRRRRGLRQFGGHSFGEAARLIGFGAKERRMRLSRHFLVFGRPIYGWPVYDRCLRLRRPHRQGREEQDVFQNASLRTWDREPCATAQLLAREYQTPLRASIHLPTSTCR